MNSKYSYGCGFSGRTHGDGWGDSIDGCNGNGIGNSEKEDYGNGWSFYNGDGNGGGSCGYSNGNGFSDENSDWLISFEVLK